ncbi:thioesterase [Rhodococcus opacus]|uniref:Thioesterase n=1 Tax=Rhodococcus opacus TaxID=37919 RepID=A0AAX3YV31_RHOOP|nr:hotdog domain-containing protein [Rhodococcus opacus]MCZ4585957.1 thioesterase [Rhodococcus opacus]WLF52087.1 thioesterase [Rhodococcus opacus]
MAIIAELSRTVTENDTAAAFGDPFPKAASTPFVLGLAEVACHNAVADGLAEGEITVGTFATIEHRLPSPIGAILTARAELTDRDGRRLRFTVNVYDGDEICASVEHHRTVADADKISARLAAR